MKCPKCQSDNPQASRYCAECGTSLTPPPDQASQIRTQTLVPSFEPFSTGTLFAGRYQIIEELGHGGMGKVYKAFDIKIQEKIAIKIIRPDIASDQKTITRFRNELKLARQITHRNICRMHDLGEDQDTHFITMEYVAGESLKKIIRMTGPLTIGTALDYSRQICDGLAEAHRLGVIHRDLKPQNILIDESGTAKIMDFGIARSLEAGSLTGEGMMVGTPEYMSPEQAEGKTADQRTDIYALGVILYEMVTGKRPFSGDTPISVALKHKSEIPRPPLELNAQIPGELNRLILKCLEKDKDKRYQTAKELQTELNKLAEIQPLAAITDGSKRITGRAGFKRSKWIPALGILFALIVIAGASYFLLNKKNIALVLFPLEDKSPEQNQGIFCEGMTDNIRAKLWGLGGVKIISKISSDQLREKNIELKEIGRMLNVQKILSGTLQAGKEAMWINMNLDDAQSGFSVWTNRYEVGKDNDFRLQDQIVNDIAGKLGVRWTKGSIQNFKKREPGNLEAYKYLRLGKHFEGLYRKSNKDEDFGEALKNYRQALALEPNYAEANWGLGMLYEARYVRNDRIDDLTEMLNSYKMAYDADPLLAEAHIGMALAYFYKADFDQAFNSLRMAVRIDPENPIVNDGAGRLLRSVGLFENAVKYFSKLADLDPLSSRVHFNLAICHWSIGHYDKSSQILSQALVLLPDDFDLHLLLGRQYLMMKKNNEAAEEIAIYKERAPASHSAQQTLLRHQIWMSAARGEKEKAVARIKEVDRPYLYEITNAYCLLGMKDEAIQNIYEGIEKGYHEVKEEMYVYPYLASNPLFDVLGDDPRFKEILAQAQKNYEEKVKKYGSL
jgi:serine/threonine protein kinase/Tfp pilus assembly protein PilF